jgi:transcriptional regulator of NAD metabolism
MTTLRNGRSSPLKTVTNHYHYHLVKASDSQTLDRLEKELDKLGFLVEND